MLTTLSVGSAPSGTAAGSVASFGSRPSPGAGTGLAWATSGAASVSLNTWAAGGVWVGSGLPGSLTMRFQIQGNMLIIS